MNSETALQFGPWVAIALFIIKWAAAEIEQWKTRRWTKEDKLETLHEERLEQQLAQQKDTLLIIDRSADALTGVQKEIEQLRQDNKQDFEQVRRVLETEIPLLVAAVRELTRQKKR